MSTYLELNPLTRPPNIRAISDSNLTQKEPSADNLAVPSTHRPPPNSRQPSYNKKLGSTTPSGIPSSTNIPGAQVEELHVGATLKAFHIHTDLLKSRSPFFADVLADEQPRSGPSALTYPDIDESAMSLFVRWLYGAKLHGPADWHSMQHYLTLYVLAIKFRIEKLCNEVMDAVRQYYRGANMTSPAYRLEYIYNETQGPNEMRRFMTATAAYRAMCEGSVSNSIKEVLGKVPELSADFANALIESHRNGVLDCRRGDDCAWHVHNDSVKCRPKSTEPWQRI